MITIGLTGSIGMGKSATANLFKDFGVPVFDADKCVHEMLINNISIMKAIYNYFPEVMIRHKGKNFIDRKILGNIVFKDKNKKKVLERIIHPEVNLQRKKWLYLAQRHKQKLICYDVPLLFETKGEKAVDEVIVVSAPYFIQRQRALKRKNMDLKKLNNILKTQMPDKDKRKRADFVVNTGNGHRFSRNQVKNIIKKLSQ